VDNTEGRQFVVETKMAQRARELSLTKRQLDLVIGSLLGDAHLVTTTRGFAFRVNHGISQKAYVLWKYSELCDFARSAPRAYANHSFYFRTVSHPIFKALRRNWYMGPKKVVSPETLEKHLNAFSLAVWIMDDGTREGNQLRINSQNFSRKENEMLAEFLRAKLEIETTLNRDRNYWRLRVRQRSMTKLKGLIAPYLIPSMLYKLPL